MSKRAVFLDRDDTIITNIDYLHHPDLIEFCDGVLDGLRVLKNAGYMLIMVTNQSGIGRGYISERRLQEIHRRLNHQLSQLTIPLDAVYFAPDAPREEYPKEVLRKPGSGMLLQAADEHALDLQQSFMVGDSYGDIIAGARAGCTTILINKNKDTDTWEQQPDYCVSTFDNAVKIIIRNTR